jgi:hypothetical protein
LDVEVRADSIGPQFSIRHSAQYKSALSAWSSLPAAFNNVAVDIGGFHVQFATDWSPVSEHVNVALAADREFWSAASTEERERLLDANRQRIPPTHIVISVSSEGAPCRAEAYVEEYLSVIFLALNLTAPGSADFGTTGVVGGGGTLRYHPFWFDYVHDCADQLGWPAFQDLTILQVRDWMIQVGFLHGHVATKRATRALLSLLNQARCTDNFSSLLWSAVIIETLFDTRREAVMETLRERIFAVLGVPSQNEKRVKKAISEFYAIRSRIVHGSFDVVHPRPNERIDERVDEHWKTTFDAPKVAQAIAIATIQLLIANNWQDIQFDVRACGVPLSP